MALLGVLAGCASGRSTSFRAVRRSFSQGGVAGRRAYSATSDGPGRAAGERRRLPASFPDGGARCCSRRTPFRAASSRRGLISSRPRSADRAQRHVKADSPAPDPTGSAGNAADVAVAVRSRHRADARLQSARLSADLRVAERDAILDPVDARVGHLDSDRGQRRAQHGDEAHSSVDEDRTARGPRSRPTSRPDDR